MSHLKSQWAIIGAGPAGIASVANLLDAGIRGEEILWIDPFFKAGDLGRFWSNVSSNTSVKLFFDFFTACQSFNFDKAPVFALNELNPLDTCTLKFAVEPLIWITDQLRKKVVVYKTHVEKISMVKNHWQLSTKDKGAFLVKNVILATGAEACSLSMQGVDEIPLTTALDYAKLEKSVAGKKKIAVFGSSHSAVILLKDLLELGIKEVVNFYLSPLRYAVFFDDWILFDDTGLKGKTAEWSRKNLHGALPKNLKRYLSNSENLEKHFYNSDAVIYATGFKRRQVFVEGLCPELDYNPHCGIIAPGLFGVGIGFPEKRIDRYGHHEMSVGLWKFMNYIKRVVPLWLRYSL